MNDAARKLLIRGGALAAVAAFAGWAAAWWKVESQTRRREAIEERYQSDMATAPGRATYISASELIANPEKYDGQRVILSGVWIQGFETSNLEIQKENQNLDIWVVADWDKISEPMGDFSRRKDMEYPKNWYQNRFTSFRIVAEGSFHYRRRPLSGFGHMGVAEGFFRIDRLFEWNLYQKETPNQSPDPTRTGGGRSGND